jgi:hypothetical protein
MYSYTPNRTRRLLSGTLAVICAGMLVPSAAHAVTLAISNPDNPTDFEPNDGTRTNGAGSFFDATALMDIKITGISAFSKAFDDETNPYTIDVWYRVGTTVGNEGSNVGWTKLQTFTGENDDDATAEQLMFTMPLSLMAGSTFGFAVVGTVGGLQWYDTDSPATYSDSKLQVTVPDASFPAPRQVKGFQTLFDNTEYEYFRSFAGSVHYEPMQAASVPDTGSTLGILLLGLAGLTIAGARFCGKPAF